MSPGRLDGLYVVVVDAGGASARVRSIDPGVRTFPPSLFGGRALKAARRAEATSRTGPEVGFRWGIVWARGYREPSSRN